MNVWLPVLKAALPFVSKIVAEALPAFTRRNEPDASAELVSQQIAELQAAVTGNAEAVKGLAAQVAQTITALDASEAEQAQQFSSLRDALAESVARCEEAAANMTALAQAQDARLEIVAEELQTLQSLQTRVDGFERQLAGMRKRVFVVVAGAMFVLIVAFIALLR
ncbi:MAG: hypothetical protein B7Y41_14605 [Hydrogenophilales bacterium 28-61-23]|nr:MAG: hypothetical protein B7Y41_14605 [Hydrogenophilales bacterium 28-61-23]